MNGPPDLVAMCERCRHRHLPTLPCWRGRYVQVVRELVFDVYGSDCWLCGQPGADTTDHVKARARGGDDRLENLRPAHGFCNTGRGAGPANPQPSPSPVLEQGDRW